QPAKSVGVLGVEANGFPKVGDGPSIIFLGSAGIGPGEIGIGPVRVQADGLAVVVDGPVVGFQGLERIGPGGIGIAPARVESDGIAVILDGLLVVLVGLACAAATIERYGVAWSKSNGIREVADRSVVFPRLGVDQTAGPKPGRIVWTQANRFVQ